MERLPLDLYWNKVIGRPIFAVFLSYCKTLIYNPVPDPLLINWSNLLIIGWAHKMHTKYPRNQKQIRESILLHELYTHLSVHPKYISRMCTVTKQANVLSFDCTNTKDVRSLGSNTMWGQPRHQQCPTHMSYSSPLRVASLSSGSCKNHGKRLVTQVNELRR